MLLALASCTKETITVHNPVPGKNDKDIVAELNVGSRNTLFESEDGKSATVSFKSIGG